MRLSTPTLSPSTRRASRRRRPEHVVAAPVAPRGVVARSQAAGGPLDNASYSCGCGMVFAAAVSTSVGCPHCGDDQLW